MTLSSLFVLLSQLGQNLLIAGLPAGDSVKVSAGIFADRHTLGSKCPADVAEVALILSRIEFIFSLHSLLGNQSSHINNPSNNLNVRLCVRSQVTRKLVLSLYQVGFKWRTTTQKLLNIFKYWCGASLSLCCGVFVFSSSSAISYLAAFNYTTGKMDAQYNSVN